MKITAIAPQVKDKTRCNIEADGRFVCGMKLETVIKCGLKVGAEVTEEELSSLQLESEKATALDKALMHISASMKTEKEIRDYLKKKGYLAEVEEYVVEKMKGYGFLDDAEYARSYVESAKKTKGARLISMELRRKGVQDGAIEEALFGLSSEESAKNVLEKYLRGKDVFDPKTYKKAYSHLLSRGFDYDEARSALASLKEYDED